MILQKAVTPRSSALYEESDHDRVAGYVMPAGAVHWAKTPAELFRAHALGFAGSPFSPDMPYLDVLRFESTGNLLLEQAVGGPDRETQRRTGGPFLETPPFTGSGFVADPENVIPVSWMPHRRVPAGTEMYRIAADGSSSYRAYYRSAAQGWVFADDVEARRVRQPRGLSRFVGGLARVDGQVEVADLVDGGARVVLARKGERPADERWTPTTPGIWSRTVDAAEVDEYFEIDARLSHDGVDFRVVDQQPADRGGGLVVAYAGHDAELATSRGFIRTEHGVWEHVLPAELLPQAVVRQTQLPGWPGAPAAAPAAGRRAGHASDAPKSSWWSRLRRS